jgi:hypothetical protein
VRRSSRIRSDEIREALLNHTHYVINFIEQPTGITFTDDVVESMLRHFGANRGYEYKAISLYNLPFGFAYMTESQDLWGCTVDEQIADDIAKKSTNFETSRYRTVKRKKDVKGNSIRFYFNNHRIGLAELGKDSMDLVIAEYQGGKSEPVIVSTRTMTFNSSYYFNIFMRRERLRLLALESL